MESTAAPATPRFDTVDVLRGLSILAVVLLHITIRFSFDKLSLQPVLGPFFSHLLLFNGGNGVTIFFAISGFLITYTSIKRFGGLANLKPAIFYRIRFARIGPPLLLLLAVLSILHLAHVDGYVINSTREHLSGALLSALTFTLGWYEAVHGYLPACWTVLWSLSVEEMFYLFFPFTCVLFLRRGRAGLGLWIALLSTFVLMSPFARTVWTTNDIWRENTYLGGMGPIALGCLTALLTVHLQTRLPRRTTLIALQSLGTFFIAWILFWPRWHWLRPLMHRIAVSDTDDLILPIGVCLVILASVLRSTTHPGNRLGSRFTAPLRWFGRHSYEVYLSHEFLVIAGVDLHAKLAPAHHTGPLWLWFAAITLLTAPLGWLIARFFSEPLNRALCKPSQSKRAFACS